MAVLSCSISSTVLGHRTSFQAIVPENPKHPLPVLYLLHGRSDDDRAWIEQTSLIRHANTMNIAVFMPQVHLSYYADMYQGGNYWTFLTDEFPSIVENLFNISVKREDTFVAGLSMGGYGALKWYLNCPEKFSGSASMSGAVDVYAMRKRMAEREEEFYRIFGPLEAFPASLNDLFHLVNQVSDAESLSILQICGISDFLYEDNLKFKKVLEEAHIDHTYLEKPGDHNWSFWDSEIQEVLRWIRNRCKNV